ncbi:hypothetical protein PLEOSDRAFT_1024233, partial [Pleurotus ostreatus PC15]
YLQFDIQWSSLALLFYDYALTFPSEVKYIWGSKMRLSTFLYIFCRYALVANVLYLLAIANQLKQGVRPNLLPPTQLLMYPCISVSSTPAISVLHDGSCDTWYKIIGALSVFGRAAVIVTFTSRTYAIYARNTYILVYLGLIGATCIALDIMHVPGLRCTQTGASRHHATGTLASFRAAAGGAMSSMVDQFGDDPVEAA